MNSRPRLREIRASDADRDLVIAMLGDAAADGRLTLAEHAERSERALAARTLGDLTPLTADLALPAGQPIRLDRGRAVTAFFSRERRDGRWVVPDGLAATAFFGNLVLDLRAAILPGRHVTIYATAIAGQIRLIVPPGITVEMVGRSFNGPRDGRGSAPPASAPSYAVGGTVEVRTLALGGSVKAITPRRSRWRTSLRGF